MIVRIVKETNQQRKLEGATSDFKSRDDLINEIEKYYNKRGYIGDLAQNYKGPNMEWYEFVEKSIEKITRKSIESLPDDDPDEGFYSNLSTSELAEVLNDINNVLDNLTKDDKTTIELTAQELNLIKTAMEMWSSPAFSKSHEESSIARDILDKLRTNMFENLQTLNESPVNNSKLVDNPKNPKKSRPADELQRRLEDIAIDRLNGDMFDPDGYYGKVVEMPSNVSATELAMAISNEYRKNRYETIFWTRSGSESLKPTKEFSVVFGSSYESVDYIIGVDTDNSARGKKYYIVDVNNAY